MLITDHLSFPFCLSLHSLRLPLPLPSPRHEARSPPIYRLLLGWPGISVVSRPRCAFPISNRHQPHLIV